MLLPNQNVAKVIFREISKGPRNDEAIYNRHAVTPVKPNDPANDIVKRHAKKSIPTDSGQWPGQKNTQLSVEIGAGSNLYLIGLDQDTRAAFGPGPNPIMVLPHGFGRELLTDIGLVYLDSSGETAFMPAKDIPLTFDQVPLGAMLSFTCDRAKLLKLWNSVMPEGHDGPPINIPIYLNLYDTQTKAPVWTFQGAGRRVPEHSDANKHVETHGGIHPSANPHNEGSAGFTTHGGIHPGTPSQLLY